MAKSTFEKIWDDHVIGDDLLFVDLHLVHEVTSAQAFEGLRLAGRRVRRPDRTLATADHNVPTIGLERGIEDDLSRVQLEALARNCEDFGVTCYNLGHRRQGIVHVIGPELGVTQPGMTIVCGDSHTSTHGAFGALAFGIGTSEVEHVLATQTLPQRRPQTLRVRFEGLPGRGVVAKDLILGLIGQEGTAGMTGHVAEYTGEAIRALSMEGRMTVCNMSIEGGARAGYMSPGRHHVRATSRAGRACARATSSTGSATCRSPARPTTARSSSTSPRSRRWSRGAPTRARRCPVTARVPEADDAGRGARAGLHGARVGHGDGGRRDRPRLHRLLHQRPPRGPARRGPRDRGPARVEERLGDGRARARWP